MKCPESVFYITTIIVRHSTRTGRSLSTGLSTLGRYCRRFWEGRGNFLDLSPTTHHHRLALRLARLRQEAEVEAGVAQGGSTACGITSATDFRLFLAVAFSLEIFLEMCRFGITALARCLLQHKNADPSEEACNIGLYVQTYTRHLQHAKLQAVATTAFLPEVREFIRDTKPRTNTTNSF